MKALSIILAFALVVSLSLTAAAAEQTPSAPATVTANGSATVSLMADTATIQIGASTRKPSVIAAQSENDTIVNAILEALVAAGIPKEDTATSYYNVNVIQPDPYAQPQVTEVQYEVSNMLYVAIKDLTKLSAVIEAASNAGANSIYGLTFASSKNQEAYDKALTRAVEDAARKAAVLAKAVGRELGDVVSVGDERVFNGAYGYMNNMDMMAKAGAATAIVSGDVSVSANITVTYNLK